MRAIRMTKWKRRNNCHHILVVEIVSVKCMAIRLPVMFSGENIEELTLGAREGDDAKNIANHSNFCLLFHHRIN